MVECDEQGWYAGDEKAKPLQKHGENTGILHDVYYDDDLVPINKTYITDILDACKKANIEVYLVSMPMYKSYMAAIKTERYDRMLETMEDLTHTYPIHYYNYTFDPDFSETDFFDSNHLNEKGANILTQKLNLSIKTTEGAISH